MSSYRGYVPWKSSLTPSYKSGASSAYSSRDDISSSDGRTRFSSIASPSTFRPSYSGGTYRSVPIKRENLSSATFVNRYTSTTAASKEEKDKEKSTDSGSKSQSSQSKYTGSTSNKENACNSKVSRLSTSSTNLSRYGRKSRDPSPTTDRRPTAITRVRSREPSPVVNNYRGRSRDPSPAVASYRGRSRDPSPSDAALKSKISSPSHNYTPSYRLGSRSGSTFGSRLGVNSSLPRSTETALSYMSSSDLRARSVSRQPTKKTASPEKKDDDSKKKNSSVEKQKSSESEPEVLTAITVVTRATSPTPPGATSFTRSRRIEIAKTVEKTIQRSSKKSKSSDKEIQSDRLDDSTRYSRFSGAARAPSGMQWTPSAETRYNSSGLRYSASPSSTKISRESPSKSENDVQESGQHEVSLSGKSSSSRSSKLEKSKISTESKSKSSSSGKQLSGSSKNSPSRLLPPTVPKAESATKAVSASSVAKLPNKDFRKSALNIGPTDRPRKSRTPSTGTDSEEKSDQTKPTNSNPPSQPLHRVERSPSVGSESSNVSTTASTSSTSYDNYSKGRHQRKTKTPGKHQYKARVGDESTIVYNKNIGSGQSSRDTSSIRDKQPTCKIHNNLSKRNSPVDSSVTKSDEAKSFLIRKLGSVSNFFVARAQDTSGETIYIDNSSSHSLSEGVKQDAATAESVSSHNPITTATSNPKTEADLDDSSWWLNTSQQIDTESALDVKDEMRYKLRHIDSGEVAWWMRNDEDDTIADDLKTFSENDCNRNVSREKSYCGTDNVESGDKSWWLNENDNSTDKSNTKYKIRQSDSGEQAWWLNSNENDQQVNDDEEREEVMIEKVWWPRESVNKETNKNSPQKSTSSSVKQTDPPWKQKENSNSKTGDDVSWAENNEKSEEKGEPKPLKDSSSPKSKSTPSDGRFWWINSPTKKLSNIRAIQSGERAWWLQEDSLEKRKESSDSESDSSNDDEVANVNTNNGIRDDERLLPLGDRASPEGLEDPSKGRKSPYRNIPHNKSGGSETKPKCFISRHTNIDELLGGSCRPLSPILDRIAGKNMFLEEITPAQVRIHDSTAQMPYIQRVEIDRDEWDFASSSERHRDRSQSELDDAALQVYKDGDYGAYLDLESSLAEQAEEIEGLNSSRKNSIVVRTQLSVRVHAIIEKLLSSEGSELRRALFSLKQIFQEDKDLVHGFVALGGLNCLVRVGNGADQNYQNYILRALGQVMLYVDGMNGVMKHGPTIQWLYSLIASKYRLVVKTALKLLLVFVEYVESNCYLLVNAVHAVDRDHGTLPWSNIMKLLKDYDNADTELLIYATSLINKTLAGLSDQDSFYDESDFLEQQGMEGVIQRYMSRPGTDLDLLDQLQLYEAVLKFEDGETDGIRLPDNSVRKTLRYRSSTDSKERRKSRRHSTGTSPSITQCTTPKNRCVPSHGTLDEDSSSSTNSNEFSGGVFRECKGQREGAGVTPGLRRRRERAERQKSFMKEQEAVANGMRSHFDKKDEFNGLGQIVTAIPVHLQNMAENGDVQSKDNGHSNTNENGTLTNGQSNSTNNNVFLSSTSISVITNGFDRKNSKGNSLSPDFVANKNVIKSNATVLNGLMRNISQNEARNSVHSPIELNENNLNYSNHKKFENESNRLNNYYSQLSSSRNNLSNLVLNQKNLTSENSNKLIQIPTNNSGNKIYSNCLGVNNNCNGRIPSKQKDSPSTQLVPSIVNNCQVNPPPATVTNGTSNGSTVTNGNSLLDAESESEEKRLLLQIKRDHTVKDLTQKLSNLPPSPQEEKLQNRIGDMTGLISKAKEGLAKSKSKGDISRSPSVDQEIKKPEPKKSENEVHWEELIRNLSRPLTLCDLDFTDLNSEDEKDVLAPRGLGGAVPPPPPPIGIPPPLGGMGPPLPAGMFPPPINCPPPPTNLVPPPGFNYNTQSKASTADNSSSSIKKNKKTVKLFWKEVREDMIPPSVGKTVWDELPKSNVDVQKLEHLFESRAKDLMTKKQQEMNKNKEIIVLDHKRSNAINIAMTKLPPPRAIKAAILKMDATVVTREGIDKLLNMLPTEEERGKIQEAQMSNPELPLGSAEQFLLTLSSISELAARLKLWAFKLDFENSEREIAEPLMDLKQGLELLKANRTFKCILSTLLSIGVFLNGAPVKGFQIEYLAKVPEVKDTVHKHSLLHHLCHMVMETSPDTTDLYSEIGPITRASKADFTELAHNLVQLETECKASWDRLKLIAKHDCLPQLKQKLVDFLADCAERIITLQIIHRRVINRYRKFLLWLGVPQHRVAESRPNEFSRIISEFALEYRTTRERVQQQIEKKANHRERNKTRGKMIIDVGKFRTQEDRADAELKQLLGSPNPGNENSDGTLTWRRRRAENLRSPIIKQNEENFTDGDDEILESLVKTATKAPGHRPTPRERKRTRHADRKSLKRSRTREGFTVERIAGSPEH